MITVATVPREEVDAWTIEESGLSVRIFNSCRKQGWRTVGELRNRTSAELLAIRSLGRISVKEIQRFFATCDAIARGQKQFATLGELLELFLDQDEREVLTARYGLQRIDLAASRNYLTLQRIGNETSRTRERVRQVEDSALLHLRSRLARTCLDPIAQIYAGWLRAFGGILACSELAEYPDPDFLKPYNPCSVLLLLTDVLPDRFSFHRQFFTLLSAKALAAAEQAALDLLARQTHPVRVDRLLQDGTLAHSLVPPDADPRRIVEILLTQHPGVLTTRDGRHVVEGPGLDALVREAMATLAMPAHFRDITKAFNSLLIPEKRKGSGFLLGNLAGQSGLSRPQRGLYGLPA